MKYIFIGFIVYSQFMYAIELTVKEQLNIKIIKIDDNFSEVIFTTKEKDFLRKVKFMNFINVVARVSYRDLDFDGIDEVLVDISSHEKYKEYAVFKFKDNKLCEFSPKTLYHFELDKEEKIIKEYARTDNHVGVIINNYCLENGRYSVCNNKRLFPNKKE